MAASSDPESAEQLYATKIRWLVGLLTSIIIVLAAAFLLVAQNSPAAVTCRAVIEVSLSGNTAGESPEGTLAFALWNIDRGKAERTLESELRALQLDLHQLLSRIQILRKDAKAEVLTISLHSIDPKHSPEILQKLIDVLGWPYQAPTESNSSAPRIVIKTPPHLDCKGAAGVAL